MKKQTVEDRIRAIISHMEKGKPTPLHTEVVNLCNDALGALYAPEPVKPQRVDITTWTNDFATAVTHARAAAVVNYLKPEFERGMRRVVMLSFPSEEELVVYQTYADALLELDRQEVKRVLYDLLADNTETVTRDELYTELVKALGIENLRTAPRSSELSIAE